QQRCEANARHACVSTAYCHCPERNQGLHQRDNEFAVIAPRASLRCFLSLSRVFGARGHLGYRALVFLHQIPEHFVSLDAIEKVRDKSNEPGPSRLMAGAEPLARVAVEVLVEEDAIAPGRIFLVTGGVAVDRSAPGCVRQEDALQPPGDLLSDFVE